MQDKAQPETQASVFGDVSFQATLAQDTPGGLPLVRQPGSDGFTLSSSPLFQVWMHYRHAQTHTKIDAHTHTRTHARTHRHTHTHTP